MDKIHSLSSSGPLSLGSISEASLTLFSKRDNWFAKVSICFLNSGSALASIVAIYSPHLQYPTILVKLREAINDVLCRHRTILEH